MNWNSFPPTELDRFLPTQRQLAVFFRRQVQRDIAFVELNNENTLLNLRGATLAELPDPFRRSLRTQWRDWLEKEYGQVARMADAWNRDVVPLGPELETLWYVVER